MGYKIRFPNTFNIDTEWNYDNLETIFSKKILNISMHPTGEQEIEFVDNMIPNEKANIKNSLIAQQDVAKRIKEQ